MMTAAGLAVVLTLSGPTAIAPSVVSPTQPRDPFRPVRAAGPGEPCAATGSRSLRLEELELTGLVTTPRGPVAVFGGGPGGKGAFLRVGGELCDHVVEAIDPRAGSVVFRKLRWTSKIRPAPTTIRRLSKARSSTNLVPVP